MAKQPPPVAQKVRHVNLIKNVISEQSSKLQQKQQLEHELLEDIRNYTNKRASIEKEYGQALQKLYSQLVAKFMTKEHENNESKTLSRTPFGLWKKILKETDATATARLKLSQNMMTNVTENIKALKAARVVTTKNCTALAEKLQEELIASVQELSKSQKSYAELQKSAVQYREQAEDAQEKLKKGQLKFFQSKAKAEKNASKVQERKELFDKRAAMARNEYILNVAVVNAHHQRYYSTDLPELIALQDGNIYEKFKDYFKTMTTLEADASESSLKAMKELQEEASQLQRAHAIQLFLRLNPVFTKCLTYDFRPYHDDKVSTLTQEFGAGLHLNKEARKWALRLAKAQRTIRKKSNALQMLERTTSVEDKTSLSDGASLEVNKDTLMEDIRHSEIVKMKAESRLDVLREAGINVDEWLQSASFENDDQDNSNDQDNEEPSDNEDDDDDDWDNSMFSPEFSGDDEASSGHSQKLLSAVALYSFQAASREELSITENEELEIIERDVDGWCKGKNKAGECGYFPETYIEIGSHRSSAPNSMSSASNLTSAKETTSIEINQPDTFEPEAVCYAKAQYDYTALEHEELSFTAGDIIKVTNKDDNGVDDGWWEGYIHGKHGTFPCILVEEVAPPSTANTNSWSTRERRRINTDTFATVPRGRQKRVMHKRQEDNKGSSCRYEVGWNLKRGLFNSNTKQVRDFTVSKEHTDLGFLTFNITSNLQPLFNWNTKQLFLYLSAEYTTKLNEVNQVILWDKIIKRGEPAFLDLRNRNTKYYFFDDGLGGLRLVRFALSAMIMQQSRSDGNSETEQTPEMVFNSTMKHLTRNKRSHNRKKKKSELETNSTRMPSIFHNNVTSKGVTKRTMKERTVTSERFQLPKLPGLEADSDVTKYPMKHASDPILTSHVLPPIKEKGSFAITQDSSRDYHDSFMLSLQRHDHDGDHL
eukprot:gene7325-8143_t